MLSKKYMLTVNIMDRLDVKRKIYGCWVHVCGNVWVQSMRMLGASLRRRLGACMRLLGASFITAESLPDSR